MEPSDGNKRLQRNVRVAFSQLTTKAARATPTATPYSKGVNMVDKQKRKAMSMEIAERLAAMRREKGFSQEDLAGQLGLSRQAISKWERGESAPDMGNLIALAELYEVSLDELIRGEAPERAAEESASKTSATEKVDVTINTFINDEKPKAANAEPAAESAPTVAAAAAPAPAAATASAAAPTCPPPAPQAQPMMPAHPHMAPPVPPAASDKPEVASEVWMTFPYPLFCALLYLVIGFLFGLWHPGWILFLTIPFFYWIVHVVKQDPNYIATHTVEPNGEVRRP